MIYSRLELEQVKNNANQSGHKSQIVSEVVKSKISRGGTVEFVELISENGEVLATWDKAKPSSHLKSTIQ